MKFKYKLVLSIILLGSFLLLIGGFSYYGIVKSSIKEQELKNDREDILYISEAIENDLLELIRLTTTIASIDVIKDSLIASNDEFSSFTVLERANEIDSLNTLWMNIDDVDDPFIKARMENDVASFLISQQDKYPDLYGEIFLTNECGVMISTTGKLTTLAHFEKYWWQESYYGAEGKGIAYLDDRGFDASVAGYVLGVVVPVYDDNDVIIGILKSNFNISYIFENSISNFHDLNNEGESYVVRTLGLIVDGEGFVPLSKSIPDEIIPFIEERIDISTEVSIDGNPYFLTISPINLTYSSDLVSFGGGYESNDHSLGNLGEGWSIVHIVDKKVALKELTNTLTILSFSSFGMLTLIAIAALYIGETLSKPFRELNTYISDVGKGKLVKKDMKITGDEIGALTISFNKLIDNLNLTLTSKEELEKEKELAQKYLDLAGTIIVVLNIESNVTLINKKGCSILRADEKDIVGKNWFDNFVPKKIVDEIKEVYNKILYAEIGFTKRYENNIITSKGEEKIILWDSNILYDLNGKISGIISSGEDVTEIRKKDDELIYMSYHDQLTGLYNRRFFEEQIARLDNLRNLPLSIIMGDVNGLKLTNDAFGHKAGDELLKLIGDSISTSIRGNDIAARLGGDEFVILLTNSGADTAEKLINRIHKKVENASFDYGIVSISFGVDTKNDKQVDINAILSSAEKLMYQNKLTDMDSIRGETIDTIMKRFFEKSPKIKEHSIRVSEISASIAEKMGLSRTDINDIKTLGLIHDIGEIVIDLNILDKPEKLTTEERKIIQQHPLSGSRMLSSSNEYSRLAVGVLHHHERIDGTGYPNGLIGDQIPIESKIIAVAAAFDAMTTKTPYRLIPLSLIEATAELQKHSGTQFDKTVVDVLINKVLVNQ